MSKAVLEFVKTLMIHFGDTKERDEVWADDMIKELRRFTPAVLQAAATDIKRTRKYRNMPLLSECLDACEAAEKRAKYEANAAALPHLAAPSVKKHTNSGYSDEYINGLLMTPMGREAAKDGWIGALKGFVKREGRLP